MLSLSALTDFLPFQRVYFSVTECINNDYLQSMVKDLQSDKRKTGLVRTSEG